MYVPGSVEPNFFVLLRIDKMNAKFWLSFRGAMAKNVADELRSRRRYETHVAAQTVKVRLKMKYLKR